MLARLAADAVLVLHLAFIVFVLIGGLLWIGWSRAPWLHLPAAAWGFGVELTSGICPLTTWENRLRWRAGDSGHQGSFVESVLLPVIYPPGLAPATQQWLALGVVLVNLACYLLAVRIRRQRRSSSTR